MSNLNETRISTLLFFSDEKDEEILPERIVIITDINGDYFPEHLEMLSQKLAEYRKRLNSASQPFIVEQWTYGVKVLEFLIKNGYVGDDLHPLKYVKAKNLPIMEVREDVYGNSENIFSLPYANFRQLWKNIFRYASKIDYLKLNSRRE